MLFRNRKGFSLIELMIVIAIIGILVAVALPQFAAMTEDAKKTKAKQDCDTFVQAIQKFNSLEGTTVQDKYMKELKGKYITNLDTMKDPWGNRYEQDYRKGIVYSKGPDGKHKDSDKGGTATSPENKDDIVVPYIGALTLVDAKLEVNPEGGNFQDDAEKDKCYDKLHLYFNKEAALPAAFDLKSAAVGKDEMAKSTTTDGFSTSSKFFRYYDSANPNAAPLTVTDTLADLPAVVATDISWGADSKEIIIKFPAGATGANPDKKLLIPGTHYINLTGAKNDRNQLFLEPGTGGADRYKVDGAEAAGAQIQIKNYE